MYDNCDNNVVVDDDDDDNDNNDVNDDDLYNDKTHDPNNCNKILISLVMMCNRNIDDLSYNECTRVKEIPRNVFLTSLITFFYFPT